MSHNGALAVERPPADAEKPSGAALVAARHPQHTLDVAVLERPEVRHLALLAPGRRLEAHRATRKPLQVLTPDRAALREGGGALEQVLELADVAREIVPE